MHTVAVLALDGVVAFDLGVPFQVLNAARPSDEQRLYQVQVTTPDGRPVRSVAGFSVAPEHGPEILEDADTVIVPGFHPPSREDLATLSPAEAIALARIRPDARLVSICTGA